jgi:hypothetical protein
MIAPKVASLHSHSNNVSRYRGCLELTSLILSASSSNGD